MEVSFTHQEVREEEAAPPPPPPQQHHHQHYQLKLCIPLVKPTTNSNHPKPFFSLFTFQFHLSKSLKNLNVKPPIFSHGSCFKPMHLTGTVINNALFSDSPSGGLFLEEEGKRVMEGFKSNEEGEGQRFHDLSEEKRRESTSSCEFLTSTGHEGEGHSHSSSEEEENSSSPSSLAWCLEKDESPESKISDNGGVKSERKTHLDKKFLEKQGSSVSEVEMMKERFSKLLLGEDMSGSGNGVCTALAISNAITNLCATLFGQLWRLEPLPHKKKAMWRREMEWLLCVCNHIVELMPSWQTFPDGTKLEVMTCRPRSDLYVNLPALRKLDNMLLEILDGFDNKEFWYVDQGILAPEADGSSSFRQSLQRQEEKWWLPVPRLPPGGLQENTRKELQHKRDSTNQILKAAMAINSITLAEMEVPELYLEALPKNGRASLGDFIYRYISTEHFNSEYLLDCLDLSSEHQAIELANQVEASIYVWRKRPNSKPANNTARVNSKSSWEMVKELMMDTDKRELLADRAESLLLGLKQRFPGLPQTTLDMSKIQYNKDVGKAILESYSRVLESLAYNIVARIDDLLYVDDLTKHSDRFSSITKLNAVAHGSVTFPYPVSVSSTPYKTAFTTPNFSPARLASPMKGERSPYVTRGKIPRSGAKKVLTDYLSIETKPKCNDSPLRAENSVQKESGQTTALESFAFMKEAVNSISSSPMKNFSER